MEIKSIQESALIWCLGQQPILSAVELIFRKFHNNSFLSSDHST